MNDLNLTVEVDGKIYRQTITDLNDKALNIEFDHELRGWQCLVKNGSKDLWEVSINGVNQYEMPGAPTNERALEEIHKSKTFPNYSDFKQ